MITISITIVSIHNSSGCARVCLFSVSCGDQNSVRSCSVAVDGCLTDFMLQRLGNSKAQVEKSKNFNGVSVVLLRSQYDLKNVAVLLRVVV